MDNEQYLLTRSSVHRFEKLPVSTELQQEIQDQVTLENISPSPFNRSPILHSHGSGYGDFIFSNEIGWVFASYLPKKDNKQTLIDAGYKLFILSIRLSGLGLSSCFTIGSFDNYQALTDSQTFHPFEAEISAGIAYGFSHKNPGPLTKFMNYLFGDSPVQDVSSFCVNSDSSSPYYDRINVLKNVPYLTWFRPYQITVKKDQVTLTPSSSGSDKVWISIGMAVAALDRTLGEELDLEVSTDSIKFTWKEKQ